MSGEHAFEDKGKVKPKPAQETAEPAKDSGSLTAADLEGKLNASTLTHMQQTVGNAAVQRFLAQRQESGPAEVQEETANAIRSKRGGGQSLDAGMAKKAGEAMDHDFSGVNVHTDSEADELSRGLGAKAFTTGSDIFFQSGAYNPGSSSGQELLAHELTHVVQQGGSATDSGKMTVNDPNDQYEQEADSVANQVMSKPDASVQRAVPEEEEMSPGAAPEEEMAAKPDPALQRDDAEEEEEMPPDAQKKPDPSLQRIGAPEEEDTPAMRMPDPTLQRAVPEEEEMGPEAAPEEEIAAKLDPTIQRAGEEEEEPEKPVALKVDPALQLQNREDDENPLGTKLDPTLQRAADLDEEDTLQDKPDPALQRQDDEELV